ncbi:hypothetical protein [Methylocystis echinoides]|uniref:hypothetical protein n=1 Tax=Methylocystis echinoides TaxID=29468 RepID=UPI0034445808
MTFMFHEDMMTDALEANGWLNVWDIYWVQDAGGWIGLTTEDAFVVLLREKNLLPPRASTLDKGADHKGR